MRSTPNTSLALSMLAGALMAPAAIAFPVTTVFVDVPGACDPLAGPLNTDELGFSPPFPVDETISADSTITPDSACPSDDVLIPNALVIMTNLTGRFFTDLWYVGEQDTTFSNVDGTVNGGDAFKIDTAGINRPLVFESVTADGVFEPGETWHFIVDDYTHFSGAPPHFFTSLGVPSGVGISTASIVAIPTPGAISLLLGAGGLAASRRRR